MSYIKKTTDQLKNFIAMLSIRFPENKDISLALTAVETFCNHNRQKLFEIFLNHVYFKKSPKGILFKDSIRSRNIDFFLYKEPTHIVTLKDKKTESITSVINGIRENWEDLDNSEKDVIWVYFDVFIKLADKYFIEKTKLKITN